MQRRLYSGLNDSSRWVLPRVLEEQSSRYPEQPWVIMTAGEAITFGRAHEDMRRAASYFESLGVNPGDRVVVMMCNSCDFVRVWLGITALGAVAVLINTALTGPFLKHQVESADAALIVADSSLLDALLCIEANGFMLPKLVTVNDVARERKHPGAHSWEQYARSPLFDGAGPQAHDVACIMYTSGTDGPSKAVSMPHAHCTLFGIGMLETAQLGNDDRFYIVLPLFHANALLISLGATLLAGISAIIRPRFSASAWVDDIRAYKVTVTSCLGALAAFVRSQPPRQEDRDHELRLVLNAPNPKEIDAMFRTRFGVRDVVSGYGMTEVNLCAWGRMGSSVAGAAGWVDAKRFEVIVADPVTDKELPRGEFGEILVRPKIPAAFMVGYHGTPEKTVSAWRNLWFHTGDGGVLSTDGLLTFVDRIRDCIRRRGENLSVTEIEDALMHIPQIAEVAAYAVRSDLDGGEDEIMLTVVLHETIDIDMAALFCLVQRALPKFMRPRYLRVADSLPKTSTGKVQRTVLKNRGVSGAYDFARTDTYQPAGDSQSTALVSATSSHSDCNQGD